MSATGLRRVLTTGLLVAACGPAVSTGSSGSDGGGGSSTTGPGPGPMTALPSGGTATSGAQPGESGDAASSGPCGGPSGCLDVAPVIQCESQADCVLYDSCCSCEADDVDATPPTPCPADCEQPVCAALGIQEAACVGGWCTRSTDCDPANVTCDEEMPVCEVGHLPTVVEGCWSVCIPATSCTSVGSCAQCPPGFICTRYPGGTTVACAAAIPGCDEPTCACLQEPACQFEFVCEDQPDGPACYPGPDPPP